MACRSILAAFGISILSVATAAFAHPEPILDAPRVSNRPPARVATPARTEDAAVVQVPPKDSDAIVEILLATWATSGHADAATIECPPKSIELRSGTREDQLVAILKKAGADYFRGADACENPVRERLGSARFGEANELAQQATVADLVVNRFLATGRVSERDLLLLMSQPKEFLRYQQVLKATAPGLEQQALAIRRVVFQRALAKLGASEGGEIVQAVIALGSWAEELNAGDMDIIVKGGRDAAKRFNELLHIEIGAILSQDGDDVCKVVFSPRARFTLETFEIYVSTLEDFGYESLRTAFHEALNIAAKEGQAAGAAHLKNAADSIIQKNLSAQRYAAVQKEYYPGASGQDFVRDYFNKQGKSRTWRVGDNGKVDSSWQAGLTADQLTETMLKDLGLSVESMSGAFKFSVIADEMVQWVERSKLGAREQAKGLVRAYDARPGGALGVLTQEESRVLNTARILASTKRESQEYLRQVLAEFASEQRVPVEAAEQVFSELGEALLWDLTKASNNEAWHIVLENQRVAVEAAQAGREVEAQYRRIKDYLMSNEQLAGYSKLKPEQLMKLAEELPADMAFKNEMAALLEFMAEGSKRGATSGADMAIRLVKLAFGQKRLSAEATEEAVKALRAGQGLSTEVEEAIAVLRRDLADVASIRVVSPAGDSLADCVRTSSLFSKGGLTVTPELEAMVAEIAKLSNIQLLQLGFKNSEIALLRELNSARAQGARLSAIGDALKKVAPKNYWAILKGYILEARKAAPTALVFQGPFSLWGVYSVVLDPSIPEEEQRKRLGEAIYATFPTAGLVLDGLPMAFVAYTEGGEVDSRALAQGLAFSGLEILGVANPVAAAVGLAAYATISVTLGMFEADHDRQFVTALYNALDGNTVKVQGGTRSFDISGLVVSTDPATKLPVVIHSAAFNDLYTRKGEVLLDTGAGHSPYARKINEAIRDFAKRYVWANDADLKIWEAAVKKNFPDIDLDQVESWKLGELTAQAATMAGSQFSVGARLVRRYLNQRDLLTESALRKIRGRLFEIQTATKTVETSKNELEGIEQILTMEKKIVPNAQAEEDSAIGWLWDASTGTETRLEQISGIWKRYVKTYGEATSVYGRLTKVFATADLAPPAGGELFGLTGVEAKDRPKIDAVYQSFQTTFDKAYQEYRGAKGGNPDPNDAFDADAWKRLLSLRMRVFLAGLQKTTQARIAALEQGIQDVLEEVKGHYKGTVDVTVGVEFIVELKGPAQITSGEKANLVAMVTTRTKRGTPGPVPPDVAKRFRYLWRSGSATLGEGPEASRSFRLDEVGTHEFTVEVKQTMTLAGKTVEKAIGETPWTVKVVAPPVPLDEKPPADAKKPGDQAPTPIPTPVPTPVQDRPADDSVVTFGGTVPGIWVGGNNPRGFDFTRQNAKTTGTGDCKWNAEVQSGVWGRIDPSSSVDTPEEISKQVSDFVAASKAWGKTTMVRPFAVGDFKGQFVDTSVAFYPGGWSDGGFRADSVSAGGRGWLIKGRHTVEVGYNVSGSGCWTNVDRAFLESQASAAQADAKSIVASLTLLEKGSFTTVPYTGPKLDGSDMPTVTLSPPALEKLKVGDTMNVAVVVQNAKPEDMPLRYTWAGEFEGKPDTSQDKASVIIKPKKPGTYPLSVSVDGARYNLGSASLAYEVADLKAEITQQSPATKRVAIGAPVIFAARLLSSGVPITGNYVYRWQPTPEVAFKPGEGPANQTTVVFSRPGVTKVWVQILKKKGTVLSTVAESNQLDIEVVTPEISLRMVPAEPYPGQEVRITASETPAVGDAFITYWWEYAGSALNPGAEANPRVYSFRPKDTTPVTVTAHAKATDGGDDLGTKALVINARPHNVQVTGPTARGPKPKVWSAQAGRLVDEEQQFAVFQDVSMRAAVTPAPVNQPLHYQWSVSPDGCSISNPSSQEPTFNCSRTGSVAAVVTVRDNLGATLGTGTGTISVSISQASLQQSQAQADAAKQAAKQEEAAQQAKLDATKTETPTKPPVDPINIGEDRLGREWSEIEEGIPGRWVRRGNSDTWDASWPNSQNNGAVGVLSMSITGDKVRISRTDVGVTLGLTSTYEGTLAPDGTVQGTAIATFPGHFTNKRYDWQARIVAPVNVPPPLANQPPDRPRTKPPGVSEAGLFNSMNIYGTGNQPTAPATFTLRQPHVITSIMTYHWNDGRGTRAGTIALRDANGRTYGPWSVPGAPGQGGVPNADWTCAPNIEIPAGTYTIIDSEPATWSQNVQSGGRGMTVVKGYPIDTTATPTTPSPTPRPTPQPTAQSTTRPDPPAVAGLTPDRPVAASPAVPDRLPATGAWVLERTEFVVEKVDSEFMQKFQPSESGEDGAGSAQSTFGLLRSRMKAAWTSPPKVLIPGKAIDIRITISDAGSSPEGLVWGTGGVGANCPALSAVWYGPAVSIDSKLGERSKEATKAYPPPSAAPGTTMYIAAEWSVGSRRNTFYYLYKFTLDAEKASAPVSASSAPSVKPQVDADRLGHEWNVTEAVTFIGRWVRRGDSDVWDASWNNGAVAVLSISIAGAKVRISRRDVDGPAIGLTGTYEGTLAADGTLQGTETVTWPGHFTNQVQSWQGRIVK